MIASADHSIPSTTSDDQRKSVVAGDVYSRIFVIATLQRPLIDIYPLWREIDIYNTLLLTFKCRIQLGNRDIIVSSFQS